MQIYFKYRTGDIFKIKFYKKLILGIKKLTLGDK